MSWFANALDLDVTTLKVKPSDSDQEHALIDSQASTSKGVPQTSRTQNEELLESILYILDKFSVGDAFYHELSMLNEGLPRSYVIKQCRNMIYTTQKTPSPIPGAQLEFEIVDELSKFLAKPDNTTKCLYQNMR